MNPHKLIVFVLALVGGCAAPATQMVACPDTGCAALDPPSPLEKPLREHAAFDLQCDNGALTVTWIDDTTAGVSGCGRQARYAFVVSHYHSRWLLDSPILAATK